MFNRYSIRCCMCMSHLFLDGNVFLAKQVLGLCSCSIIARLTAPKPCALGQDLSSCGARVPHWRPGLLQVMLASLLLRFPTFPDSRAPSLFCSSSWHMGSLRSIVFRAVGINEDQPHEHKHRQLIQSLLSMRPSLRLWQRLKAGRVGSFLVESRKGPNWRLLAWEAGSWLARSRTPLQFLTGAYLAFSGWA